MLLLSVSLLWAGLGDQGVTREGPLSCIRQASVPQDTEESSTLVSSPTLSCDCRSFPGTVGSP